MNKTKNRPSPAGFLLYNLLYFPPAMPAMHIHPYRHAQFYNIFHRLFHQLTDFFL